MFKSKLLKCLLLTFLFCFISLSVHSAEAANNKITIIEEYNNFGREVSDLYLNNGSTVAIDNSEELSKISVDGKQINEIQYGFIDAITEFAIWEDQYLLIEYRYHGSGSILYFQLVDLSKKSIVYESQEISRGKVEIKDTGIDVITPNYHEDDSFAEPSEMLITSYEFSNNKLIETSSKVLPVNNSSGFRLFSMPTFQNPSAKEINELLTRKALENNIPPEVLKAIAWQESRWRQFNSNGEPLIGIDGRGIGIMQVTPGVTGLVEELIDPLFVERLRIDIEYNIDMGIKILLQKWNWTGRIIPRVNDGSWDVIDNWYFAIIAYNGLSRINDPNWNKSTSNPPFQTHIYNHFRNRGLLTIEDFPINQLDIFYNANSNVMRFGNKMQYDLFGPMTRTSHAFRNRDVVRTTGTNLALRNAPGGTVIDRIPRGEIITITGNFQADNNRNNHFVWYPIRRSNGQTGFVASSFLQLQEDRFYGPTRFATAVGLSQKGWHRANTVVLARGDEFPDALAGGPLAHHLNAPMLLTRSNRLDAETKKEIERLQAKNVVILGGNLAINANVEKELRDMGLTVDRIAGSTRFDTAKLIADRLGTSHSEVIVINVDAFADAMAIAPYAARNKVPILLTRRDSIPQVTRTVLDQADRTILIGGNLVISDSIARQMPNVRRFNGRTRYDTAAQIVRELHPSRNNAFLVSGLDFPDGLTASVLAAAHQGDAILLTDKYNLPNVTRNLMNEFSNVTMLGGPLAISDNVVMTVRNR